MINFQPSGPLLTLAVRPVNTSTTLSYTRKTAYSRTKNYYLTTKHLHLIDSYWICCEVKVSFFCIRLLLSFENLLVITDNLSEAVSVYSISRCLINCEEVLGSSIPGHSVLVLLKGCNDLVYYGRARWADNFLLLRLHEQNLWWSSEGRVGKEFGKCIIEYLKSIWKKSYKAVLFSGNACGGKTNL